MTFFEEKYMVTGRHGDVHSLTAKQLYERVLKDAKTDYNWIASESELVRICKEKKQMKMQITIDSTVIMLYI